MSRKLSIAVLLSLLCVNALAQTSAASASKILTNVHYHQLADHVGNEEMN